MKSTLRVVLILLCLAATGSTAVGSQQQMGGGPGPVPACDGSPGNCSGGN